MEQGDDSSFPRDKLTILKIKEASHGKVIIDLSDESSLLILKDLIILENLEVDTHLTHNQLDNLVDRSDALEAERKALSLISRVSHSIQGLQNKLKQRGFSDGAIRHAVDRLKNLDYLNDRKFAEEWVRSRIERHPEGKYVLLAGLLSRGIDREIAEDCISRLISEEVELDCARRFLTKSSIKEQEPGLTERSISKKLLSRGFPRRIIRLLLEDETGN